MGVVGFDVGFGVGDAVVGLEVGLGVGFGVGDAVVGLEVGLEVGFGVVGALVGWVIGLRVGLEVVGALVGLEVVGAVVVGIGVTTGEARAPWYKKAKNMNLVAILLIFFLSCVVLCLWGRSTQNNKVEPVL